MRSPAPMKGPSPCLTTSIAVISSSPRSAHRLLWQPTLSRRLPRAAIKRKHQKERSTLATSLTKKRSSARSTSVIWMPAGQYWYVSVIVAKGTKPGKRIALVSGVHGDEISPIRTIQAVMDGLDPAAMSGAVLAVLDVSRPAIEGMMRRWPNSGRGIDLIDMNREWPGNENGVTPSSRHAGLLFNRLLRPNADYAIDFHTGTTGFDVTAFNIAEMDLREVKAMVELYPVGQIFDNHVYPGVLHNAFMNVGIPSFTPEIGAGRALDHEMISLF